MTLLDYTLPEYDDYGLCLPQKDGPDVFMNVEVQKDFELPKDRQTVFTSQTSSDNIFDSIMSQCAEIAEKLDVHILVAFMILETQNWNVHKVWENWPQFHDSILQQIGIKPENVHLDPSLKHPPSNNDGEKILCEICYDEFPPDKMWVLECGHAFCEACWRNHMETKISHGEHIIQCQMDGCKCKVPPSSIRQLCGDDVYNNLLKYMMDQQVSLADTLTNCPNRNCGKPVDALNVRLCGVLKCPACSYEFCSQCNEESHAPASCAEKSRWELLTGDERMNSRIFGENVKTCPKCKVIIEKNEGCNHMTCRRCHHEFCWKCMRDWANHPKNFYNCEFYKQQDDPFLKQGDEIHREFIGPFYDNFTTYKVSNKAFKERMPQLIQAIVKQEKKNPSNIIKPLNDLFDLLYWTKENIRWGFVHGFNILYQEVLEKKIDINNQVRYINQSSRYKLYSFALNELKDRLQAIENSMGITSIPRPIDINTINSHMRILTLYRETFLKHSDMHYST